MPISLIPRRYSNFPSTYQNLQTWPLQAQVRDPFSTFLRRYDIGSIPLQDYIEHALSYYLVEILRQSNCGTFPQQSTACAFKKRRPSRDRWHEPNCYCISIPTGMFTICRSLYAEISKYFYCTNKFSILAHNPCDLDVLYHLSGSALSSMTSLTVHLHPWPCRHGPTGPAGMCIGEYGCEYCGFIKDPFHDVSKGVSSARLNMMAAWEKLCKYLSGKILSN